MPKSPVSLHQNVSQVTISEIFINKAAIVCQQLSLPGHPSTCAPLCLPSDQVTGVSHLTSCFITLDITHVCVRWEHTKKGLDIQRKYEWLIVMAFIEVAWHFPNTTGRSWRVGITSNIDLGLSRTQRRSKWANKIVCWIELLYIENALICLDTPRTISEVNSTKEYKEGYRYWSRNSSYLPK